MRDEMRVLVFLSILTCLLHAPSVLPVHGTCWRNPPDLLGVSALRA